MKMLSEKKILITGGAGFIGSNLCAYFLENNEVICLDNLSTGFKKNIEPLLSNPKFRFVEGDIRDFDLCVDLCKEVDVVMNQAALGSVPRSIEFPLNTNNHNITGFLNILYASVVQKVSRFIYASSSSVYGDNQNLPKVESKTGNPMSPYAVTKVVNELYAKTFSKLYDIETIGLRYFNVFGPNQNPNGAYASVIPKFVNKILNGEQLTVNGKGDHTRDFTFIDNVIHANEIAALNTNESAMNELFNIAYGQTTSLNQLIDQISVCFQELNISVAPVNVKYGPERLGDIKNSYASVEKAKEFLGYMPTVDLRDGILKYLKSLEIN